jgi:Glycosyltransferase family 87
MRDGRTARALLDPVVWKRPATHALCFVAPAVFTVYMIWFSVAHHAFAYDFDRAFWPAGQRVLDGVTPYASPTSFAATHGFAFVYPAPGAFLFAAFASVPRGVADVLFTAICIAAAFGALRVLNVRDWRVYGVMMLWPPVISGWQTANLSLLLALGMAVAWRGRDRPVVSGSVVGLVISLKLFLWPLAAWLLLTRRWRASAWMVATGFVINAASWALIGVDQLSAYERLARAVTTVEQATAYTPLALAMHLGAGKIVADLIAGALAIMVAALCMVAARRRRDDKVLLGAIVLSLLATPIVWRHYFVLLLVPLAITRPRLSAAWAIPLLLLPVPVTSPRLWELMLALTAIGLLVYLLADGPVPDRLRAEARTPRGTNVALSGSSLLDTRAVASQGTAAQ